MIKLEDTTKIDTCVLDRPKERKDPWYIREAVDELAARIDKDILEKLFGNTPETSKRIEMNFRQRIQDIRCHYGVHNYEVIHQHRIDSPDGLKTEIVFTSKCKNCGKIKKFTWLTRNV